MHGDPPAACEGAPGGALDERRFGGDIFRVARIVGVGSVERRTAGAERAVRVELDAFAREPSVGGGHVWDFVEHAGQFGFVDWASETSSVHKGVHANLGSPCALETKERGGRRPVRPHLVDFGEPVLERDLLRGQDRRFALGVGGRRDHLFHERHRRVDQHAGRLTRRVHHDPFAVGRAGLPADPCEGERLRVGPARMAIDSDEPCGPVLELLVVTRVRRKRAIRKLTLVPTATDDPAVVRVLGRVLANALGTLFGRGAPPERHLAAQTTEPRKVSMRPNAPLLRWTNAEHWRSAPPSTNPDLG